ncbi:MAG: hypothetical protein FWG34_04870 [Oscillospiraceae bacterium]|nr:hypothetical protein [Oscillospiraceae bacterium]
MNESGKKPKLAAIKSALGKSNKLTTGISFLLLFLIMFGLFAFILTGLYRFGLIEFPAFIQNLFFKPERIEPEAEKDDKNIYDFFAQNPAPENYESGGEGFVLEITLENAREAIANTKLPENLHLEMEARYYTNGEISRTEEMFFWKKGEKCKYLLNVNSVPEELYINDSQYEFFENFATGSKQKRKALAFSIGSIPHMPDINYYLGLLEGGEITKCELNQTDDSNVIAIEYMLPQIFQRELIHISIDTGIVLDVCSYDANDDKNKYYECVTAILSAYYDGASAARPINDSLFEIK